MHLGGQGHGEGHHLLHAFPQSAAARSASSGGHSMSSSCTCKISVACMFSAQGLVHAHHGQLDDVRGGALDGVFMAARRPNS